MAMTDKDIRPSSPDGGIYKTTNASIRDIEI